MIYRNNKLRLSVLALVLALASAGNLNSTVSAQTTFTTGDVYSSTFDFLGNFGGIGKVPPAGGAVSNTFSTPALTPQIAWSADLTTAYAITNGVGLVLKLTPNGTVATFANLPFDAFAIGTHPDGRILVATLQGVTVYDFSAGGAGPFPVYATLPESGEPQTYAIFRTSAGRLLISGNFQKIYDITDPGNITVFADVSGLPGFPPPGHLYDMAEGPSGEIYAWSADSNAVIKVTGGIPSIFATLPPFGGFSGDSVAYGNGKLLVGGTTDSFTSPRVIYDLSAGGDFLSLPPEFATHGVFALGGSLLDTVPPIFVPSPQDQLAALIAQVEALVPGTLTQNQANQLINKLENALKHLNKGQTNPTCNQLGQFINNVNSLINNGSLTAAQGQALIDAANAVSANIGC